MNLNLDKSAWKRVTFGDVVQNVNETLRDLDAAGVDRIIAMEHMDPGELKINRWGSTDDGTTFTRRVKLGQTLFGKRRAYQRKVAYAEFDAICSGDIYTFEADETQLLGEFLPFLVQSNKFFDHALGTSAGSLSPRTNWRDLANFEFDLPPLDEQKSIADLLWAIERHRRALQGLQHEANAGFEQARLALLTVGPRGAWRSAGLNKDEVNTWTDALPSGWSAESVASVGRVRSGATPNRSQQARYFDGGEIPWVKTLDLNEDQLDVTDEKITDAAVAETSAKVVPKGTVLVAMYGGFGQIGRTARLGVDAATNQAVSAVLDLRPDVDPRFLHEVLKAGRPKWRKVAASSRKDPNITKADVENFDFPLPPLDQQVEILANLQVASRGTDAVAAELTSIGLLRDSTLTEVFGGI